MYVYGSEWKGWLLPGGIIAVFIWGLYLAVSSALVSGESPNFSGEKRSASRVANSSNSSQIVTENGLEELRLQKHGQSEKQNDINVAKENGRVAVYKAVRKNLKSAEVSKQRVSNKPPALRGSDTSKSSKERKLRQSIMNEAYRVALRSKRPWLNLSAISSEYYRRGDRPAARKVIQEAAKLAIDPDDAVETSEAMSHVVKTMLSQKQNKDAISALQNIRQTDEREKAMADIAVWAARDGKLNMAKGITAQLSKVSSRDSALVAIAESQASYEGGDVAFQTAENVDSDKKKNDTYRRIALQRARLSDFQEADLAITYIDDDKSRDKALSQVAKLRAKQGDLKGGLKTLQSVTDPSVEDAALRAFSDELAKSGWFSSSSYVTTRIDNSREKSFALERLSLELAKSGDVSSSLLRTDAIPLDRIRERALRSVSTATADRGAVGRARNVAFRILSDKERDKAYRNIVEAAASKGNHTAAFNTLQEIEDPKDKALAFVSLARSHQKNGRERKALALLENAQKQVGYLDSVAEQDIVNAGMSLAYAEASESGRSLNIVEKIENVRRRDVAYQKLAKAMAARRDVESAQRSLLSISSDSLRRAAEDSVAKTLARKVSPKKAVKSSRGLHSGRQRIIFLLEVSKRT